MCGGYTIATNIKSLEERFGSKLINGPFNERFNARPSQNLPIITNTNPKEIKLAHWGIKPAWAKEDSHKEIINARSDSSEKPTFKKLFESKRCLILADGFYEWEKRKDGKYPFRFTLKDDGPFAMAGIYDVNDANENLFTIITVNSNKVVGEIHDRMPAILLPEQERDWLDKKNLDLLKPYPDKFMESYEVSRKVNFAENDFPDLIKEEKTRLF